MVGLPPVTDGPQPSALQGAARVLAFLVGLAVVMGYFLAMSPRIDRERRREEDRRARRRTDDSPAP